MTMNPEQVPTYECLWPVQDTRTTCVRRATKEADPWPPFLARLKKQGLENAHRDDTGEGGAS